MAEGLSRQDTKKGAPHLACLSSQGALAAARMHLPNVFGDGSGTSRWDLPAIVGDIRPKDSRQFRVELREQIHGVDLEHVSPKLLQCRFNRKAVQASSVGQALYDTLVSKGVAVKQNQALKLKYDEFGNIMRANFAMEAHGAH
jgi:hypothetical protein